MIRAQEPMSTEAHGLITHFNLAFLLEIKSITKEETFITDPNANKEESFRRKLKLITEGFYERALESYEVIFHQATIKREPAAIEAFWSISSMMIKIALLMQNFMYPFIPTKKKKKGTYEKCREAILEDIILLTKLSTEKINSNMGLESARKSIIAKSQTHRVLKLHHTEDLKSQTYNSDIGWHNDTLRAMQDYITKYIKLRKTQNLVKFIEDKNLEDSVLEDRVTYEHLQKFDIENNKLTILTEGGRDKTITYKAFRNLVSELKNSDLLSQLRGEI